MEMKPTEQVRVSYIINIASLLHDHVSATLVGSDWEMSYKGYVTAISKNQCKCKILI